MVKEGPIILNLSCMKCQTWAPALFTVESVKISYDLWNLLSPDEHNSSLQAQGAPFLCQIWESCPCEQTKTLFKSGN